MASITKTATGWRAQVKVRVPGRDTPLRDSKVFSTQREAKAWGAQREIELKSQGQAGPAAEVHTLRDALRRYAEEVAPTHKGEHWELVRLAAFEANPALPVDMDMTAIEEPHIAAFRDARLKRVAPSSVRREMSLLSAVFTIARKEWKWIKHNPFTDVKRPRKSKHRERVIEWHEIRRILRILKYRVRAPHVTSTTDALAVCFMLALRTGMRSSELCELTWDRVYDTHVHLPDTKNETARDVPLSTRARRLFERLKGWDDPLVLNLDADSRDVLFRKARERAKLEGFTFHDSRHTAATIMARKVDALTLCKIFGWRDLKHALVYYNPKVQSIAKQLG